MVTRLRIFFMWSVLLLPTLVTAQNSWEIAIFDEAAQQILWVTAEGIQDTISVPTLNEKALKVTAISPDYRYAAGFLRGSTEYAILPAIADLQQQTCCLMFDIPENESFFTQFSNFAPDNTLILSTNNYDWQNNTGGGLVFLVDAASGTILKQKQLDVFAYPGDWDGTDFYYLDAPLGGTEWLPIGNYSVWETDTDAVTKSTTRYALFHGEVLPATGEVVTAAYNENFPLLHVEFMFPPGNTIVYYPAGSAVFDNAQPDKGTTVFFSPHILEGQAAWVHNGDALLAYNYAYDFSTGEVTGVAMSAVFRTGIVQNIDTAAQRFITGTPDGWLMFNANTLELLHYIVTETGFQTITLGKFTGEITLLTQPDLIPTMSGTFPEFVMPEPTPPPNAIQCPGTLPSRLQVGKLGWILPGEPNNFRSSPSTSGEQIGQLLGNTVFTVLEGPVCANNLAWWRVRDGWGQEGWTAEGNRNAYWTAPLN